MERVPFKVQIITSIFVAVLLFWGGAKYQELRLQSLHSQTGFIGTSTTPGFLTDGGQGNLDKADPEQEAAEPNPSRQLFIHVVGAVEKPGVYQFEEGERVNEAIRQAVPLPEADLSQLNLALPLQDGKQIDVPFQLTEGASGSGNQGDSRTTVAKKSTKQRAAGHTSGQTSAQNTALSSASGQGAISSTSADGFGQVTPADQIGLIESNPQAPSTPGEININTASQAELESLHGIGPALAQRIIAYRQKKGSFSTVEELLEVSGIGPATLAKFREQVTVE